MRSSLFRWFAVASLVAGVFYFGALAALFFNQRAILYHAAPRADAPEGVDLGRVQVLSLHTSDNETLLGWYMAPQPGRPTILFFDGNGGNGAIQEGRWRRVAAEGVGLLTFVYRGYPGSTGRTTEAGLHRDALAAYAWLARRTPPDQIVLHGHSLGTGLAVRLAAEHPARAFVLEAPYTSTTDVAAEKLPYFPVSWLMQDRFESDRWIGRVRIPVLVVHGELDSVIPFHFGQRLYALAHSPKQFVAMPDSDHNTLVRDGLYDHVWTFLHLSPLKDAAPETFSVQDYRQ